MCSCPGTADGNHLEAKCAVYIRSLTRKQSSFKLPNREKSLSSSKALSFSGRRWTCLLTKIHAADKIHTVIFTEQAEAWLRLGLTSGGGTLVLTTSQLSRAMAWTPPVASANCPWTETSGATLSCRGNEAFYDYGSSLRRQAGVRAAPRGRNDRPAGYHAGSSATMCIFIYFLNELPLKIMKL